MRSLTIVCILISIGALSCAKNEVKWEMLQTPESSAAVESYEGWLAEGGLAGEHARAERKRLAASNAATKEAQEAEQKRLAEERHVTEVEARALAYQREMEQSRLSKEERDRKESAERTRKAEEDRAAAMAAAELAYQKKYVRLENLPEPKEGQKTIVVALSDENEGASRTARNEITRQLESWGWASADDVLTQAFFTDGIFSDVWKGDSSLLARLGLDGKLDRLLFLELEFGKGRKSGFDDLTTVDGTLSFRLLDAKGKRISDEVFRSSGMGLDETASTIAAAKRLTEWVKKENVK